jgi:hypothetical protein
MHKLYPTIIPSHNERLTSGIASEMGNPLTSVFFFVQVSNHVSPLVVGSIGIDVWFSRKKWLISNGISGGVRRNNQMKDGAFADTARTSYRNSIKKRTAPQNCRDRPCLRGL